MFNNVMKCLLVILMSAVFSRAEDLPMTAGQWIVWTNGSGANCANVKNGGNCYWGVAPYNMRQERDAISVAFPVQEQVAPQNTRPNYIRFVGPISPLTGAQSFSITFGVETKKQPTWNVHFSDEPDNNGPSCTAPAALRFYFERRDLEHNQSAEYWRWFSDPIKFVITNNTIVIGTVDMTPDQWISVFGKRGNYGIDEHGVDVGRAFEDAKADPGADGFVLGGGCFAGHGVNISGPGGVSAKIAVSKFEVQR